MAHVQRLRGTIRILGRATLFASVWLIIAGTDPAAWLIGGPAVLAATWASLRLSPVPQPGLSVIGLARFIPYFLWESLRGGLDIARRVTAPRLAINPGIQDYRMRLTSPTAQVVFLDGISLIPGTLSADLRGRTVRVHTVDSGSDIGPSLLDLERRVAALFGEALAADSEPAEAPPESRLAEARP